MSYSFAPWQGATHCTSGSTTGALALQAYLLERYSPPGWSGGIYNCRGVRGSTTTSVHGEGRAFDLMLPVGANGRGTKYGHDIVDLLGKNAQRLGIQCIIYDRRIWSAASPNGRAYTGVHPHYDHLHIELTRAAGANLTLATLRAVLGTAPSNPTEDTVYVCKFGDRDNYVRRLQRLINAAAPLVPLTVPTLTLDGVYGPATAAAVNAFAARAGMPADGNTGCHALVVDYIRNFLSVPAPR